MSAASDTSEVTTTEVRQSSKKDVRGRVLLLTTHVLFSSLQKQLVILLLYTSPLRLPEPGSMAGESRTSTTPKRERLPGTTPKAAHKMFSGPLPSAGTWRGERRSSGNDKEVRREAKQTVRAVELRSKPHVRSVFIRSIGCGAGLLNTFPAASLGRLRAAFSQPFLHHSTARLPTLSVCNP